MAKKKNYTAANGTEYYRIRKKVGEDSNGKAIMKAFYGSGKLEAEEKYRQYMKEQELAPNKNRNDSFGKIAKYYTYQVMLHENLAPGTIELYERQYREKLAPAAMMIRPIKEISSADIQTMLNVLAKGRLDGKEIDVSQSALKNLYKYLKRLFKYLSIEGYCQDIMISITLPRLEVESDSKRIKEIEVFTEEEIRKIIETPNRKQFLFQLALATGLRAGELLALTYDDFKDGNVSISKQINTHYKIDESSYREYERVIQKPKSSSSIRTVPLPLNVQAAFKKYVIWHRQEMLRNGYRTDHVFTSETGRLLDKGNLRMSWIRHLKRAGVEYKKFHACRSTYCTTLCKNGVPLETASKLMGHSDVNITAEFYRLVSSSEMKKAADKIDSLFSIEN